MHDHLAEVVLLLQDAGRKRKTAVKWGRFR